MVLGLVAFILYLWFFVGFEGLFGLLSRLDLFQYTFYFSLAIAALLLAVFFDSLIWHSLLKALSVKIKLRRVVLYNWIGNFVELVIPCETVCGEVTRIYLSQKETQGNVGTTAATVISSRIISTFVYTGGLLAGFISLIIANQVPIYIITPLALVVAGTAAVLAIVFYVALKEGAAEKLIVALTRLTRIITKNRVKFEHQKERIQQSLLSFSGAFRTYKENPRYLVKPAAFAVVAWFFNLLVYLMVFYSLGFGRISIIDLAVVYCITMTVETLTAGFPVGAVEITMINLYTLYGVPIAIAVAATTLTRVLTFWCQIFVGYPLVNWLGVKPLIESSLQRKEVSSNPA